MNDDDPHLEERPNKLLRKISNPEALRSKPDLYLIQKLDAVVARERQNYLPEMAKLVEGLVRLLREQASPSQMWPIAHELRCMAGTFGFELLGEVARNFCTLIQGNDQSKKKVETLPPDVSQVFAAALLRARDISGEYSIEEEAILLGLRTIVARELKARG